VSAAACTHPEDCIYRPKPEQAGATFAVEPTPPARLFERGLGDYAARRRGR
jgi:hypothetical protein